MKHVTCVFDLAVEPDHLSEFKSLINDIVDDARRETGTVIREYSSNAADEREIHIDERYEADAVLPHINETFAPHSERLLALAQIKALYGYGETSLGIRNKLDDFGAVYFTPLVGISK